MDPADARLQSIGATFAVHYYTALVQAPDTLAALYTPTACVTHNSQKASGVTEIGALLTTASAAGLKEVKLEDISASRSTSGGIKVKIAGQLIRNTESQAFTQEVEMRELESNVFGITCDKMTYTTAAAADHTGRTTAESTVTAAAVSEEKEEARKEDVVAPATSAAPPKETASSRKSTPAPAPAAAAAPAVEEPRRKPSSFAEALKMKKVGEGAAFSNKAMRVVASDKTQAGAAAGGEKAEKAEAAKKHTGKKDEKSAKPRAVADKSVSEAPAAASGTVVYYDIIIKELSPSVTEEEVRAMVTPVAAVKLVNVVRNKKHRRSKESERGSNNNSAAAAVMTFAFVQLDCPPDAPASHVKDVVLKLSELNKELHIEEVREKKLHAAAGGNAAATHGRKRGERKGGEQHKGKSAANAPSKPHPKKQE